MQLEIKMKKPVPFELKARRRLLTAEPLRIHEPAGR